MNKIILIVFLILGITVNVFGATREKILRTGLVDTFAELDAIVADKALVNLADGGTFTGNIIANGNLSIGNAATTAGVLTLLEDTDAGSNFASFQVPALAANTIYTLPNAVGAAGNVLTDAAGNGILSWVEGGAGAGDITSVGDVATGAAFDGTQGTILTFYDVGGNMTLTYNGTTLTASKYITANVTGALTGNADTVTNGVYTGDAGTVFLAPAGDGASLTNVIHTEVDPTVDTAAEILTILDDTALDFGTGVLTATGFAGPLTGNADTVTNATLTTALTVNTGAVTLVGNAGASALTLGAGASSFSGTSSGTNTGGNTGDNTVCTSGTATTAATLATERAIYGNNFNGSAALTQVIASTYGGTGNGFTKFTGPTTAEKTFTLPDANATLLYSGGALGTPSGGTLTNCSGLPYTGLANGTDGNLITWAADATIAVVATGDVGQVLTSGGVGVAPTFQAAATAGASTALDNLVSVAINLGLLPGTTDSIDLGSTAKLWQAIYVSTANISRMFTHIVYVGTGSAFTTIDSALNVVVPGDTILVESSPTAYDEAITFDDDNITLKAIGSKENTTITQANATIVNFGVKSNCVLDGFTIDMLAATTSERRCITGANDGVTASTKNIIRNCDITYTSSADIINRPVNFTNGYWKIENCNITLTTTATSPNTTYALQTTNSDGIELVHTKIKVYADSATGTPVIACWVNAATTILDEMRDCELYLSSSAITAGALYAFIANATTTNIYNSKLTVICSSTANVKTITNGSGQTINSYGNIYTATNSDNDGKWASIASGATLNSYGDSIIDGSLSNAGTANIYSTTTEGDLYVFGEMSAQSIDDRASKFGGDALADVMKVKDIAGNIDPTTLPQHIQIPRSKEVWNKDLKKTKTEVISIGKNLGDMVLMNMRAIQQLEEKIKDLKKDAD